MQLFGNLEMDYARKCLGVQDIQWNNLGLSQTANTNKIIAISNLFYTCTDITLTELCLIWNWDTLIT